MTKEKSGRNIDKLRGFFDEVFLKRDLTRYEHYVDQNVCAHCPLSWQWLHAVELENSVETKKIDNVYFQAFKYSQVDILDIFADGDQEQKVVVRWACKGIHVYDFFGIPASNAPFSITGITIYSFTPEGKINEVWQSRDMLGLLQQIGAI